jgi:hypothetical protein
MDMFDHLETFGHRFDDIPHGELLMKDIVEELDPRTADVHVVKECTRLDPRCLRNQ